MWEYEHTVEAEAGPAQVWARYVDVATWPEWNPGMVQVTLDGPFATGTTATITREGQDPMPVTITEAVPGEGFTDEAVIPDAVTLRFIHQLVAVPDGGTRITHRVEIEGPAAEALGPEIGPLITGDFPEILLALAKAAGQTG